MSGEKPSTLHLESFGLVANNKELNSDIIQAVPIGLTPFMDGEIASLPFDTEAQGTDSQGNAFNVKVQTDQAVPAKWLRLSNSNRLTPPDVRRGMRVLLWKFADKNEYFWSDSGLDPDLLKLETVVYQISATADESVNGQTPGNCYYIELSSHKKTITLQTAKANGEYCLYVAQFNMADGRVVLADDLGNDITLDSQQTTISMENAESTTFALERKNIIGYAPDSFRLVTEKNIDLTCKTFQLTCETGTITASSGFTIKTPRLDAQIDQTTFMGNVEVGGSMTAKSGTTFQGPATFQQRITANGIVSSAPIVGPSDTI